MDAEVILLVLIITFYGSMMINKYKRDDSFKNKLPVLSELEIGYILTSYLYWESRWIIAFVDHDKKMQVIAEQEIALKLKSVFYMLYRNFEEDVGVDKWLILNDIWLEIIEHIKSVVCSDQERTDKIIKHMSKLVNSFISGGVYVNLQRGRKRTVGFSVYQYLSNQKLRIHCVMNNSLDDEAQLRMTYSNQLHELSVLINESLCFNTHFEEARIDA